jgi:protein SCO1
MDRSRLAIVAGVGATLACRGRPASAPSDRNRSFAEAVIAGSRRRFPNPLLTSHDGRPVRLYDDLVRGRFVLLNFAYTRCEGKCPRGLRTLLAARSLLLPRLGCTPGLVTLTLDPEHDTPEVLGRFVAAHGGPGGWTCLTGAPADLDTVRRFLGFVEPDPRVDADRSQHGSLVAIGDDPRGRWQVASTQMGAAQIAQLALRTAGVSSQASRPASACHHPPVAPSKR